MLETLHKHFFKKFFKNVWFFEKPPMKFPTFWKTFFKNQNNVLHPRNDCWHAKNHIKEEEEGSGYDPWRNGHWCQGHHCSLPTFWCQHCIAIINWFQSKASQRLDLQVYFVLAWVHWRPWHVEAWLWCAERHFKEDGIEFGRMFWPCMLTANN